MIPLDIEITARLLFRIAEEIDSGLLSYWHVERRGFRVASLCLENWSMNFRDSTRDFSRNKETRISRGLIFIPRISWYFLVSFVTITTTTIDKQMVTTRVYFGILDD